MSKVFSEAIHAIVCWWFVDLVMVRYKSYAMFGVWVPLYASFALAALFVGFVSEEGEYVCT